MQFVRGVGSHRAAPRLPFGTPRDAKRRRPERLRPSRSAPGIGVGVVSRQVVDAAVEVAAETDREVMLVASRRQVDDARLGGGYVEGWTTACFARYVRSHDPDRRVKLCRDHGGPWQHANELRLSEQAALESALRSLRADVDAGFDLLHIDTSCEPADVADRLHALVAVCDEYGVALKAHNCDYLDAGSWQLLARSRVGAANVAPEYGVAQTRSFLELLRARGLHGPRIRFLELAYRSERWQKWLANPPTASPYERAVLAGHYVFSHPEVAAVLRPLHARLEDAVKNVIERHLDQFRFEA